MWDATGNSVVDHVDLLDPCWDLPEGLGLLAGVGHIPVL